MWRRAGDLFEEPSEMKRLFVACTTCCDSLRSTQGWIGSESGKSRSAGGPENDPKAESKEKQDFFPPQAVGAT